MCSFPSPLSLVIQGVYVNYCDEQKLDKGRPPFEKYCSQEILTQRILWGIHPAAFNIAF